MAKGAAIAAPFVLDSYLPFFGDFFSFLAFFAMASSCGLFFLAAALAQTPVRLLVYGRWVGESRIFRGLRQEKFVGCSSFGWRDVPRLRKPMRPPFEAQRKTGANANNRRLVPVEMTEWRRVAICREGW